MNKVSLLKKFFRIETKQEKEYRLAFKKFRNENFKTVYNKLLQFCKDEEFMRSGLSLTEKDLKHRVYAMLNSGIENGVINEYTFEVCNPLEFC